MEQSDSSFSITPLDDVAKLRAICRTHSKRTSVSHTGDGLSQWVIADGRLSNTRSNFFSVGRYRSERGEVLTLMEQPEQALVVLLVADIRGRTAVLLSLRTEPGLIGLTNLSSTIQSTPSNYLRRHGGKATPFIDVATSPESFGEILYEGEHHDWGSYYVQKTKRFLMLKLNSPVTAPPGYLWTYLAAGRKLLLEDHLITNDLRVSLSLLLQQPTRDEIGQNGSTEFETRETLEPLSFQHGAVDDRGTRVAYVQTETETREVTSWVQPLLVPKEPMDIRLATSEREGERFFAVVQGTQCGLLGHRLWFPADIDTSGTFQRVETSAEGGRFWQHLIRVELVSTDVDPDLIEDLPQPVTWVTRDELAALVATPITTSLELRMAWSLVIATL